MAVRSATAPFSSGAGFTEDHPLFAGFLPAAPEPLPERLRAYDLILVVGAPVFTFHVPGTCALFQSSIPIFHHRRKHAPRPSGAARDGT
jgi:benzoylformate decarboxylase